MLLEIKARRKLIFRTGKTWRLIALCIERYNAKKFGRNDLVTWL